MNSNRYSLIVSKLTALLVMASLCSAILASGIVHASPQSGNGNGRRDKVSSDLRQQMGGNDSSDNVKVILQIKDKVTGRLNALLNRHGVHVNGQYRNLKMLAVELPLNVVGELASYDEVSYLSLDREIISLGGHLSTATGADAVRQQTTLTGTSYTLDGSGIGIAFLDSGLYSSHKAFTGRIGGSKDYTGENRTDDSYGHGTHVAGIAAGNGSVANGKYIGIAPNATIYNLRVLNSRGVGTVSGVLAALNDLLAYHAAYNIRVVNMSLGMPAIDSYKDDPVCKAVRRLVDAGVVVAAAAGNDGKDRSGGKIYGLIHSPGNEPSAITVGASNTAGTIDRNDDVVTTYSSRGPTRSYSTDLAGMKHYDNLIKPDLVAPGNKIIAPEAVSNYLVLIDPTLDAGVSKFANQKMMRLNGSSMATPVVAGTAALLLQLNPRLTPNMVKAILMYTAQPLAGYNMFEQGAGEINIEGAVRLAKSIRRDLTATTATGTPMLTGATLPVPQTTLAYYNSALLTTSYTTFPWSQGVILGHTFATGTDLISSYQAIYGTGVILGDGVIFSDGIIFSDTTMLSRGVLLGDNILTSNGIAMSGGTTFIAVGVMLGDGVIFTDGVIFGDGVIFSDSGLIGDGVIFSDSDRRAHSAMLHGDNIPGGR